MSHPVDSHERRLREALARARTVLFVCLGNVCRSPFAAGCARNHLSPEITALSAGTYPSPNRPSPPAACEVAAEFGVDLRGHRAVVLSEGLAQAADVIVIFDEINQREVSELVPSARDKMYWLGALSGRGRVPIADPFGGEPEDYREVYEMIDRLIRSID
jgi:protein-tyrosine-phosphatase